MVNDSQTLQPLWLLFPTEANTYCLKRSPFSNTLCSFVSVHIFYMVAHKEAAGFNQRKPQSYKGGWRRVEGGGKRKKALLCVMTGLGQLTAGKMS